MRSVKNDIVSVEVETRFFICARAEAVAPVAALLNVTVSPT